MALFVEPTIIPDTETHRTCSVCFEPKEFSEFYKDGKNKDGTAKLRRDCKDCYRKTRLRTRKAKRTPPPAPVKGRRKK